MVPPGFSSRPATVDDADAIYQLVAAAEIEWHGQAEAVPDQVAADLRRPELHPEQDTLLVHAPDGELAGWAWVHLGKRAQIEVHPSYHGLGIGTALLDWAEQRSREVGSDWLAQAVDDQDKAGTVLLRSRGYDVLATNWLLERPLGPDGAGDLPDGLTLTPYNETQARRCPRAHRGRVLRHPAAAEVVRRVGPADRRAVELPARCLDPRVRR